MGRLLKWTAFPFGRSYKRPSDHTEHSVAEGLLYPGEMRGRMTDGIFVPHTSEEPLKRIDDTLHKVIAAELLETRIQKAVKGGVIDKIIKEEQIDEAVASGIINESEAARAQEALTARREVVRVDDFPQAMWRKG